MKNSLQTSSPALKNAVDEPFFICCSGRSGSSHLCLMLNNHPLISCGDEIGYITELVSDDGEIPDIETYRHWLKSDRIFFSREYEVDPNLDFHELVTDFLCCQEDCSSMKAVGAVSHHNFVRLLKLWPKARFIHLVRDGRDVTFSWLKEIELHRTAWFAVQPWIRAEQEWDRLAKELSSDQYIEITYEQFVSDVEGTLDQVCRFLKVPYDSAMLSFAKEGSYFQRPDPKYIGLWRTRLSPREVKLAEACSFDLLTSRGYTLSHGEPMAITPVHRAIFRLREIIHNVNHTVERFGWRLFLLERLNRRVLKSRRLENYVKERINFTINAQLKH